MDKFIFSSCAFEITAESKLPQDVIETDKGFYLLAYRDRKTAPMAELDKNKDAIRQRLLQRKQNQVFEAWLQNRKDKSEISIEPNFQGS